MAYLLQPCGASFRRRRDDNILSIWYVFFRTISRIKVNTNSAVGGARTTMWAASFINKAVVLLSNTANIRIIMQLYQVQKGAPVWLDSQQQYKKISLAKTRKHRNTSEFIRFVQHYLLGFESTQPSFHFRHGL